MVVTQSVAPVDVVPAKLVPVAGAFEASSSSSSSSSAGFPNQNVVLSHHVPPVNVIPPAGGSSKTSSSSSAFQENFSINKNPQNGFFDGIFNVIKFLKIKLFVADFLSKRKSKTVYFISDSNFYVNSCKPVPK